MSSNGLRVVADAEIPGLSGLQDQVDLLQLSAADIDREAVADADALLIRTLTRADESLLAGSSLRFLGTATSGVDHVDCAYLAERNIHFVAAGGSNANAVVDYCFTALAFAVVERQLDIRQASFGIVGAGNVGGLLARKLGRLGCKVLVNDPPLRASGAASPESCAFASLEEVLASDVISLHIPLSREGEYATINLLGRQELEQLKNDVVLINSSRGEVVDESALLDWRRKATSACCVIDVWQGEPVVSSESVALTDIATPHIAGYSKAAKAAATSAVLGPLREFFKLPLNDELCHDAQRREVMEEGLSSTDEAWQLLLREFPLRELSQEFKAGVAAGRSQESYKELRVRLRQREEFREMKLSQSLRQQINPEEARLLEVLGFE